MASLFKRPRSPYFWIQFREGGDRIVRKSTGFRHALPAQTRRAMELLAETRRTEQKRSEVKERWENWVPQFLSERYEESPRSLDRYLDRWRCLSLFLQQRKLLYPSQLKYSDLLDYIRWRRAGDKPNHIKAAAKNTALAEITFLGLVMKQAVRLGFSTANPCTALGIKKSKPAEKHEITGEHLATIWKALEHEPEWMRLNFLLCLYTGCRLREARLPVESIDMVRREIHFVGKGDRAFTVPMRDELVPWLERLKSGFLFDFPSMPSKKWTVFYRSIGLPQYSTHCLRVTFITLGARAGIPEREMCRLVNHSNVIVHRIYTRLRAQDLRVSVDRIPLPSFSMHPAPESPDAAQSSAEPPSPTSTGSNA